MLNLIISCGCWIAGAILGIVLAIVVKKKDGVGRTAFDIVAVITNVAMIVAYLYLSTLAIGLAMFSEPKAEGLLCIVGYIVTSIISVTPFFFGAGLGLSVVLRRRGRRVAGFIAQFAGVAAVALEVLLYIVGVSTSLLMSLN